MDIAAPAALFGRFFAFRCGGKSTAMRVIRERLEDRSIAVFVVPEAATVLFTAGAKSALAGLPKVAHQELVARRRCFLVRRQKEVARQS